MTASVFAAKSAGLYTTYRTELTFRSKLMGGIPKDPKVIEAWLRAKAGISSDEEVRQAMLRTLTELGADVNPDMTFGELTEASAELASTKQTNGFKKDADGLFVEDRQIKAMIKESVNILYAGNRWGVTKKGPRAFTAERVFINPERIHLGRQDPDGIELMVIHASGPKGPVNSLAYHEYVERPVITFDVMVTRDSLEHEHWPEIWLHAQENGMGACRSQSYGRFDVTGWSQL